MIQWAQKEFAFTVSVPENQPKREWLLEQCRERVLSALDCKSAESLAARDCVLSSAQLCRINSLRSNAAKHSAFARQLNAIRDQFANDPLATTLPLPRTKAATFLLRPRETLFDLLRRFNYRCQSEYMSEVSQKARGKVAELAAEVAELKQALAEAQSREPGLRPATKTARSQQRTSDYASAQSAYLAQRPTLDEGLRALNDSAMVHLQPGPAQQAQASIAKRTASLRYLRADDSHARRHLSHLLRDKPLVKSFDGAKVNGFTLGAYNVFAYLPEPEDCVLRFPLAVLHLNGASAADYDAGSERAFLASNIEEKRVVSACSDGAATNIGSQNGALQLARRRTGNPLCRVGVCLDHTADLAWNTGLLAMTGRDPVK